MRQKAPMVEQVYSCIQHNGLNVLLDNNLESTFIEINLHKKGISSVAAFVNILTFQ